MYCVTLNLTVWSYVLEGRRFISLISYSVWELVSALFQLEERMTKLHK